MNTLQEKKELLKDVRVISDILSRDTNYKPFGRVITTLERVEKYIHKEIKDIDKIPLREEDRRNNLLEIHENKQKVREAFMVLKEATTSELYSYLERKGVKNAMGLGTYLFRLKEERFIEWRGETRPCIKYGRPLKVWCLVI